jgi:hypothetical protein
VYNIAMAEPKILTREQIIEILKSQNFEHLSGVRESQQFEFKLKRPYDFTDTNIHKNTLAMAELAKDVASMANSQGGVIVCGFARKEEAGKDLVGDPDYSSKENFYSEREIIGRINLAIYPTPDNISLEWFPSKHNPKQGVGAIIIPAQKEEKKYFVVRVCAMEGETLKGTYFGVPMRNDDKPDWLDLKDLRFLRQKKPSKTEEQYTAIMEELKSMKANISSFRVSSNKKNRLDERMKELINE